MVRVRRAVAVLVATVIVGALGASSAGAHITKNVSHAAGHMKKYFFTKAQSDARYFTMAAADARFAPAGHDHDASYFTQAAADDRFAPIAHDHDGRYPTWQEAQRAFASAPPPTPYEPPYGGAFTLEIDGLPGQMLLDSVAGCFPRVIGEEAELCHLSVRGIPEPLVDWLDWPTVSRDLTIRAVGSTSDPVERQLSVRSTFITEATVRLDAASSENGTVDLVVAPGSARLVPPTEGSATSMRSFVRSNFSMEIPGMDTLPPPPEMGPDPLVTKIERVGIFVPAIRQLGGGYEPGDPEGHVFTVGISASTTWNAVEARGQWEAWGNDIADGKTELRDGSVRILAEDLTTVLITFELRSMVPLTQLSPFKVGNAYTIELGRHDIQIQT